MYREMAQDKAKWRDFGNTFRNVKISVWGVMPCSVVPHYQCFGGTCYFQYS
jgi:hypothetical protein